MSYWTGHVINYVVCNSLSFTMVITTRNEIDYLQMIGNEKWKHEHAILVLISLLASRSSISLSKTLCSRCFSWVEI